MGHTVGVVRNVGMGGHTYVVNLHLREQYGRASRFSGPCGPAASVRKGLRIRRGVKL